MSLGALSYAVCAVPCSGATVPHQKPRKADGDQQSCHRGCRAEKREQRGLCFRTLSGSASQ